MTVIKTAGVLYFACSLSLNLFRCGHPYLFCFHSFLFFQYGIFMPHQYGEYMRPAPARLPRLKINLICPSFQRIHRILCPSYSRLPADTAPSDPNRDEPSYEYVDAF
jgi:hypothetical protein